MKVREKKETRVRSDHRGGKRLVGQEKLSPRRFRDAGLSEVALADPEERQETEDVSGFLRGRASLHFLDPCEMSRSLVPFLTLSLSRNVARCSFDCRDIQKKLRKPVERRSLFVQPAEVPSRSHR